MQKLRGGTKKDREGQAKAGSGWNLSMKECQDSVFVHGFRLGFSRCLVHLFSLHRVELLLPLVSVDSWYVSISQTAFFVFVHAFRGELLSVSSVLLCSVSIGWNQAFSVGISSLSSVGLWHYMRVSVSETHIWWIVRERSWNSGRAVVCELYVCLVQLLMSLQDVSRKSLALWAAFIGILTN